MKRALADSARAPAAAGGAVGAHEPSVFIAPDLPDVPHDASASIVAVWTVIFDALRRAGARRVDVIRGPTDVDRERAELLGDAGSSVTLACADGASLSLDDRALAAAARVVAGLGGALSVGPSPRGCGGSVFRVALPCRPGVALGIVLASRRAAQAAAAAAALQTRTRRRAAGGAPLLQQRQRAAPPATPSSPALAVSTEGAPC